VCVDYADFLERTLATWADGLDDLLVVTTTGDRITLDLCASRRVRVYATDAFYRNGATFNKAGALDDGVRVLGASDWLLSFDADILPPADWRSRVEASTRSPGHLYSVKRVHEDGRPVNDAYWEVPGYFHLFHTSDPVLQVRPLFGDWQNASGYDTAFCWRWHPSKWRFLRFTVTHLGDVGQHWCGRGNVAGMAALRKRRLKRGAWMNERLR
jgi:hypothetical protein